MLDCQQYRLRCMKTGKIIESGVIYLYFLTVKAISLNKMKVLQLKSDFEKVTLAKFGNDPELVIREIQKYQDKIVVLAGLDACPDALVIERLFQVMDPTPKLRGVDLFNQMIAKEKFEWASSGSNYDKNKHEVMAIMLSVYSCMKMAGDWNPTTVPAVDPQIVALKTQLIENKKLLSAATNALVKANSNSAASAKSASVAKSDSKPAATPAPAPAAKFDEYTWRTSYVGETTMHPIKQTPHVWCGKGHGKGSYMPEGHNHEQWVLEKQQKAKFHQDGKRTRDDGAVGDAKMPATKKGGLKLTSDFQAFTAAIKDNLKEKYHLTENEAAIATDVHIKEESKE